MPEQIQQIIANLQGLGVKRLATAAAIIAIVLTVLGVGSYYLNRPAYETLYVGLERSEVNQIGMVLGESGISFDVGTDGTSVMVPAGRTAQARMLLAEKGLPSSTNAGYELFDHVGSLGLTSFMQEVTRVRALDPALRLGEEGLAAGDVITTGGLELRVVPTPGHTADSLSFHLPADRAVLTGDTILGRGTTVVAHPDGRLGDYLDSLRRLRSLTVDDGVHVVLPGHGPVLDDAQGVVEYYLAHRATRLAQVETAVEDGYRTPAQVVAHVYADVDRSLWPAAELSVRAQMDYLEEHGLI